MDRRRSDLQDTEIRSLRLERDAYRVKYGKARADVTSLEAELDKANDQIGDLKRALQQALEPGLTDSEQAKPQVALTRLSSPATVKIAHAQSARHEDNSDSEVEYIGNSTAPKTSVTSKARDPTNTTLLQSACTPESYDTSSKTSKTRIGNTVKSGLIKQATVIKPEDDTMLVPCVRTASTLYSIQHDRGLSEIQKFDQLASDSGHSTKRRRVTPVSHSMSPGNNYVTVSALDAMNAFYQQSPADSSTVSDTPSSASARQTAKIGPDASIFPPFPVSHYLDACKPLDISPPPSVLCVPRKFISERYGGCAQHFLQYFDPKRNPSAAEKRRLVFPRLDMNPAMPTVPGEPGLIYASRHEILDHPPWTLFCRDTANLKNIVWRYLGEYENELCGKMSPELFNSQEPKVKQKWAEVIIEARQWDVYVAMRARIALRTRDGMPLSHEAVIAQMSDIRKNVGLPVSVQDVVSALQSGEEAIDIIRMQCVSYDHIFLEDMTTKFQVGDFPHGVSRSPVRTRGVANRRKPDKGVANDKQWRVALRRTRPVLTTRFSEPAVDLDDSMSESENDDSSYIDEDDESPGLIPKTILGDAIEI